jgi:hypothetical protein
MQHKKSQNFLEYIARMTQLVCLLYESNWQPGDSFLSIGDNKSTVSWIKKSNFNPDEIPEQASHLALARHMTTLLLNLDVIQFGQWLPGVDNGVADALSRRHDLSDSELTEFINISFPSQVPTGFRISPLHPEITSWAIYWVQHVHGTKELPPELFQKATLGGKDGWSSSTTVSSTTTSSSADLRSTNDTCYSGPLPTQHGAANGPNPLKDMTIWLQEHAVPPSTQSARPSLQPVGTIPARTRTASLHSFYNNSSKGIKTMTLPSSPRKQSPSAS